MKLWAGLAELRANPNCKDFRRFGKDKGAFVWVVAWEKTQSAFEAKVKVMSESLDCILYCIEQVEPFEERIARGEFPEEFINMRATATKQPRDTVFGTLHIWHRDDRD